MVLIDSSIWIEYFKGNESTRPLDILIEYNSICVNDLILAELLPSIIQKKELKLHDLLLSITRISLTINWENIILMQSTNLKNGINKIGISDLIIAQNAIDNDLELFTLDKHFALMSKIHGIQMYK